ncbi:uncharacterized protein LOC116847522 isoform X1 [Odontomachus brunneus]|uniref:uncharacterized protein LOC116847522 isoform X1 n=1 Tax=Odontomachus brunneus TaxID=486640 RepID=UPI0013F2480D|nr:uncharacterized protein LOC116847522 isoform X1 [Odontomachus brunneus]
MVIVGVYRILCSCGKVYIEETGRMVNTRTKEHQKAVKLKNGTQSALEEHNLESGHKMRFDKVTVLARTNNYFPRKYRESLEIQKHLNNLNRDNGLKISPIRHHESRKNQIKIYIILYIKIYFFLNVTSCSILFIMHPYNVTRKLFYATLTVNRKAFLCYTYC